MVVEALEIGVDHPQGKFVVKGLETSDTVERLFEEFTKQVRLSLFPCDHRWSLVYCGRVLNRDQQLSYYGIMPGHNWLQVAQRTPTMPCGELTAAGLAVFRGGDNGECDIKVPTFHVSCQSDKLQRGGNYVGILLLASDQRTDWQLGGVHCRAGYIYVKEVDTVVIFKTKHDSLHAKAYFSLFGRELDDKVVGCGFSLVGGKFSIDSIKLSHDEAGNDKFHAVGATGRATTDVETICILQALIQWHKTGSQNWQVKINSSDAHKSQWAGHSPCQDCAIEKLKSECWHLLHP